MKRILEHTFLLVGWFAIMAGILLILLVFFWLNYPYKPLYFTTPITIIEKEARVGEMITYTMNYCKTMNLPSTVIKEYIDGVKYVVPPIKTNAKMGCNQGIGTSIVPNLPAGKYTIRFSYVYQVNPLREVTIVAESDSFTITP